MHFLAAGTDTQTQSNIFQLLWPFALMFVVLYFLLIRPQQKRQKTRNSMLSTIKKGDKVVTIGGIHGTILEMNDQTVIVRVNDVTKLTFDRSAVNNVVQSAQAPEEKKSEDKKAEKKSEESKSE